ncbi:MAG TPA: carboxypeptidase-like regulatory domain-containing protein [Pyrinomonadaceae bacterium]|nr:carboxypeptidase-like regulatory domain-containing protein [Pyrinomonadaceae bacterium]
MAARSTTETKRVRYLLDLLSPAERDDIESEYFEDDDAFQEMLTAEDDLIDTYARGELAGDERRRFEKKFASSVSGRDRVQFARAFSGAVSAPRPVKPNFFKTIQSPRLLRTATIAAVIVVLAVFAWLGIDRRRMTNELRELHAQSAELNKRTQALQQTSDPERIPPAESPRQLADPQSQIDKPRYLGPGATHRTRYSPKVKNSELEQATRLIHTEDGPIANTLEIRITELPIQGRRFSNLLPSTSPQHYVAGGRADQSNITLDGVDVNEAPTTYTSMPQNASSSGGSTVRGTAKDPNGNVVSGATVTLTDSPRNFTRTQSTNKDGAYVFKAIPPGTYSVEVTAPGFKTVLVSGVAALVNTPIVLDVPLEIGAISETVTVSSAAESAINTSDATIGNSFERKGITELPLNADNGMGLLSLRPGVSPRGFVKGGDSYDVDATIRIPKSLKWIRFQIELVTAASHDYGVIIKTADGHLVTSDTWTEPFTPNQTIIDTPALSTRDLHSGDYVLLLMEKKSDGSFVRVAEHSFKVIKLTSVDY